MERLEALNAGDKLSAYVTPIRHGSDYKLVEIAEVHPVAIEAAETGTETTDLSAE